MKCRENAVVPVSFSVFLVIAHAASAIESSKKLLHSTSVEDRHVVIGIAMLLQQWYSREVVDQIFMT